MRTVNFKIPDDNEIIIIDAIIDDKIELKLAIDTAATHTTIDSNILHLSGYGFKNKVGKIDVETSSGVIIADIFKIEKMEAFGEYEQHFDVQVYDFLSQGITSNYDGVIGLDFLKKRQFCLDIANGELKILS